MSRYVEQLLDLAEGQAADVLAAAHAEAEELRTKARADATKIGAAALDPGDGRQPQAQRHHDSEA